MNPLYYNTPQSAYWHGRVDGTDQDDLRWHQAIECVGIDSALNTGKPSVSLLGFACDEGVRRNHGRVGSIDGPQAIRKVLSSLPVHFPSDLLLYDRGDVTCPNENLEEAQVALGTAVRTVIQQQSFPIVLGGGHEVTYGHFRGLMDSLEGSIGIINIDAHFDLREPMDRRPSSGTGFYQIRQDLANVGMPFHYLALGIQEISNTRRLFHRADEWGVDYMFTRDFYSDHIWLVQERILAFAEQVDHVYLTVDMDAFAASYAPGVSALAFNGLVPNPDFFICFDTILQLANLVSVDIAELNPQYDIDHRTARLAADLIFRVVGSRSA